MHRVTKYALYGLVLAGIAGGTIAFTTGGEKAVALEVDGQTQMIHTSAKDVAGVVTDAGYTITSHDMVAPSPSTRISAGDHIVLRKGRLLHLNVNGQGRDIWVTAPTVAAALQQLGYPTTSFASVSRSTRLPIGATHIDIRTPKLVAVKHDGKVARFVTTAATVQQVLGEAHVSVGRDDRLSVAPTSAPKQREMIIVTRVARARVTKRIGIAFGTTTRNDSSLAAGQTRIASSGRVGTKTLTYAVVYVNGKLFSARLLASRVTKNPLTRIVKVGTRASTPDEARALGAQMAAARGWGSGQFSCLNSLWTKESNWRVDATNPDGGAYGIPQALPAEKLGSVGSDWRTNAATQITWGLNYIASVYGSPCNAWSHSQALNWY